MEEQVIIKEFPITDPDHELIISTILMDRIAWGSVCSLGWNVLPENDLRNLIRSFADKSFKLGPSTTLYNVKYLLSASMGRILNHMVANQPVFSDSNTVTLTDVTNRVFRVVDYYHVCPIKTPERFKRLVNEISAYMPVAYEYTDKMCLEHLLEISSDTPDIKANLDEIRELDSRYSNKPYYSMLFNLVHNCGRFEVIDKNFYLYASQLRINLYYMYELTTEWLNTKRRLNDKKRVHF